MGRNKARQRSRQRFHRGIAVILAIGGAYTLAGAHTTAVRVADISAAQTVAARFPQIAGPDAQATRALIAAAPRQSPSADLALLNPEPMLPQSMLPQSIVPKTTPPQATPVAAANSVTGAASDLPAPVKVASAEIAASPRVAVPRPASEAKATPPARRVSAERPGYLLNDAQIADIKTRLSLTPDQEDMWPAVEAALRNMRGQPVHTRGLVATQAAQTAAVDPDSVQGLKSAAVPLILSFNDEQKDQVRSIVHAMGLDQLASQF
jgi:hypothetical protein